MQGATTPRLAQRQALVEAKAVSAPPQQAGLEAEQPRLPMESAERAPLLGQKATADAHAVPHRQEETEA